MGRRSRCSCKTDTGNSSEHIYAKPSQRRIRRDTDHDMPVLLSPDARARNFEQTIRTIVSADFDGDASVAPDRIAFFAEVEVVDFMIRGRGRRKFGGGGSEFGFRHGQ
jgi:hypothetical protein